MVVLAPHVGFSRPASRGLRHDYGYAALFRGHGGSRWALDMPSVNGGGVREHPAGLPREPGSVRDPNRLAPAAQIAQKQVGGDYRLAAASGELHHHAGAARRERRFNAPQQFSLIWSQFNHDFAALIIPKSPKPSTYVRILRRRYAERLKCRRAGLILRLHNAIRAGIMTAWQREWSPQHLTMPC